MALDPEELEVTGAPIRLVEGVANFGKRSQYAFSGDGTLLYAQEGEASGESRAVWVDRDGAIAPLPMPSGRIRQPSLSPDGTKLAFDRVDESIEIWVHDIVLGGQTRLTLHESAYLPAWSPNGERIVFGSGRSGTLQLHWKRADGAGRDEQLTRLEAVAGLAPTSWSPDGTTVAFTHIFLGDRDIWTLAIDANGVPGAAEELVKTPYNEYGAVFSPDGRWLAYMSNESGQYEVYVRPFPEGEGRWRVSSDGGVYPRWSKAANELFYRESGRMMLVPYTVEEDRFLFERARELFELATPGIRLRDYDVTPDGQRFVVLLPEDTTGAASTQLVIVLNWFDELRRLVPTN